MLARWLQITRLEPLRADCAVERCDGVDLRAVAEQEMRLWYLGRLDRAPFDHLQLTDLSTSLPTLRADSERVVTIKLPAGVRRVASVWLSGWERPVVPWPVESKESARVLRLAACPFTRPGVSESAALIFPGGVLRCYCATDGVAVPTLVSLLAVCDPGPDSYIIDDSELPPSNP